MNLAAGGYNVQMFFNGSTTAGSDAQPHRDRRQRRCLRHRPLPAPLPTSSPGPIRPTAPDGSAATMRSCFAVAPRSIDVIGQIGFDPGTEWGAGNDQHGRQHADARLPAVCAGDADGSDAFDPSSSGKGSSRIPLRTSDPTPPRACTTTDEAPAVTAITPGDRGLRSVAQRRSRGHLQRAGECHRLVVHSDLYAERQPSAVLSRAVRRRSR